MSATWRDPDWNPLGISAGFCRCGCGQPTAVVGRNRPDIRLRAGEPMAFQPRHRCRLKFVIDANTGCWVWQGGLTRQGYPRTRWDYRHVNVHRALYKQVVGPIDDALVIDHLCRNRACVNPDHLEPVTNAENVRRGASAAPVWEVAR